jgi:predicted lipoprotein with Yx(FWY)xxD motif
MSIIVSRLHRPGARRVLYGGLVLGAVATVAACGSSSSSTGAGSGASSSPGTSSSAAATISAKNVGGFGPVLVDGQGRTLYMLTSEKGGKRTCTDANGCTKFWPEITLPAGTAAAKAGSGVQASLLGTVKDASGTVETTYNGWPVYTYAGDSGPGQAKGEGITSFGGTWYVLNASGTPVTSGHSQPASSPSAGGGGAYGY